MYVVAGVTGHVGSVVAEQLLAEKQPLKVIVRDTAKAAAWSKRGAEVALGSLEDQTFLTTALRGAKAFLPKRRALPISSAWKSLRRKASGAKIGAS